MKPLLYILIINLMLVINCAYGQSKRALIIVNNTYQNHQVQISPYIDSVSVSLAQKGFRTEKLENLERIELRRKLRTHFTAENQGTEIIILVSAGAKTDYGQFFFPPNANIQQEADIEFEGINLNLLFRETGYSNPQYALFLVDIDASAPWKCYNSNKGFGSIDLPVANATLAFTPRTFRACSSANELYWANLHKWLLAPNTSVDEALAKARHTVIRQFGNQCAPWENYAGRTIVLGK